MLKTLASLPAEPGSLYAVKQFSVTRPATRTTPETRVTFWSFALATSLHARPWGEFAPLFRFETAADAQAYLEGVPFPHSPLCLDRESYERLAHLLRFETLTDAEIMATGRDPEYVAAHDLSAPNIARRALGVQLEETRARLGLGYPVAEVVAPAVCERVQA